MTLYRGYEKATRCSTGPTPGAKALMAWFLGRYQTQGGKNLGIFNCRTVRGATATTSLHGEGRACDFGINPHGAAWGTGLAELLRVHSGELGIQCVIWNRRIWSGSYPDAGWRAYSGTNPHVDHIHLELSKAAAAALTPEHIHRVLTTGPQEDELSQQQVDQINRNIGFARDQIMTHLGKRPDMPPLPAAQLPPVEVARRVDVGSARDQLVAELATVKAMFQEQGERLDAQADLLEAIAEKLGINFDTPGGQS